MVNDTLGHRIKNIRLEKGLTMKEFGEKLNPVASDSLVSRWEKNVNAPNKDRMKQISEIGGVTEHFLRTGQESTIGMNEEEWLEMLYTSSKKMKDYKEKEFDDVKLILIEFLNSDLGFVQKEFIGEFLKFINTNHVDDISLIYTLIQDLNETLSEDDPYIDPEYGQIDNIPKITIDDVRNFIVGIKYNE